MDAPAKEGKEKYAVGRGGAPAASHIIKPKGESLTARSALNRIAMSRPQNTEAPAAPLLDEAAIERAEAALQAMAEIFESWIDEEVALLSEARAALKANGVSLDTIDALSRKAHDLKGQGTTLNFPLVTTIADLLCKLCEDLPSPDELPVPLVDAHVDAVRAIVRDGIKGEGDATGQALVGELKSRVRATLDGWRDRGSGER